jgi:hypothetical protein
MAFLAMAPPAEDSSRELARKIAAELAPRETVAMTVRNASSLAPADVATVRRELESALRGQGFALASEAPASVAVTLSENAQGLVWIAEVRHADRREVVMIAPARGPERAAKTQMSLDRQPIVEQPDPILDAVALDGALVVLEPGEIVLHRRQGARWERRQALPLPARVWPRDLRGRLTLAGDSFEAFLPGVACHGKFEPELTGECAESGAPWPGGAPLAKGRNYFEAAPAPYYSAARLGDVTLAAGLDGRTHLYDAAMQPAGSFAGWGGEIVTIETGCGGGRQALATRPGGASEADAIQAFEISGSQPSPASAPVEFTGPVVALWPAGPAAAVAISRDAKTGGYAAHRISATCSR